MAGFETSPDVLGEAARLGADTSSRKHLRGAEATESYTARCREVIEAGCSLISQEAYAAGREDALKEARARLKTEIEELEVHLDEVADLVSSGPARRRGTMPDGIQRYWRVGTEMEEADDGRWVLFSDVQARLEAADRLAEAIEDFSTDPNYRTEQELDAALAAYRENGGER